MVDICNYFIFKHVNDDHFDTAMADQLCINPGENQKGLKSSNLFFKIDRWLDILS